MESLKPQSLSLIVCVLTPLYVNIVADQVHPLMETVLTVASLSAQTKIQGVDQNPMRCLWDVLNKNIQSMETLPQNLED